MISLENLSPDPKARKRIKRVGRGESSGRGKTCCRGQKGQKSRSGVSIGAHFEGGQMPIQRRLPKFGFTSQKKLNSSSAQINVGDLNRLDDGQQVDLAFLKEKGLVPKRAESLRVLGKGVLEKKLVVKADYFTPSAKEKIVQSKGTAEAVS